MVDKKLGSCYYVFVDGEWFPAIFNKETVMISNSDFIDVDMHAPEPDPEREEAIDLSEDFDPIDDSEFYV